MTTRFILPPALSNHEQRKRERLELLEAALAVERRRTKKNRERFGTAFKDGRSIFGKRTGGSCR